MRLGTYYRYLVIQKLCLPTASNRILDIGGYDGFILSKLSGENKTLIDLNIRKDHKDIIYISGDFLTYGFDGEMFSTITAFDVIEHVQSDKEFLEKMISLLSSGGVAIISTPCKRISIFPNFIQPWIDKKWQHVIRRGYDYNELENLIPKFYGDLSHEILTWNCPVFRLFYLPLSMLWRFNPTLTKIFLRGTLMIDTGLKSGDNGFLFVVIRRGAQ